jgi:hypothetical protein
LKYFWWVGGGCVANKGLLARELVPRVELSPGISVWGLCEIFDIFLM